MLNNIQLDAIQSECWRELTGFHHKIQSNESILARIFGRANMGFGFYLYGGTGRGKTMLMNEFFANSPIKRKIRLHFFEFMGQYHQNYQKFLSESQSNSKINPWDESIKNITNSYDLICFDEFHVVNIADAMILGRLITQLIASGVSMVFTSNFAPEELYEHGLQRENFLPFVNFVRANFQIFHLNSPIDYRVQAIKSAQKYIAPNNPENIAKMQGIYQKLCGSHQSCQRIFNIAGYERVFKQTNRRILWVDFHEICGDLFWVADYLNIAHEFDTIFINNLPQFTNDNLNEMRRFITMIDIFYEKNLALFICSSCAVDDLLQTDKQQSEFMRTISRIKGICGI